MPSESGPSPSAPETSVASPATIPVVAALVLVFVLAAIFVALVHQFFPIFRPAPELLAPFPPDEIAVAREAAFQRGRLFNPMLALGTLAFFLGIGLPLLLQLTGRAAPGSRKFMFPLAVLAAVLACIGVVLAHLVMELTSSSSLGLGRLFLARWLEFAFFGAGVGAAVGAALGGRRHAGEKAIAGAVAGFLSGTVLDLVYVPIATAQVDVLIPGGVAWGSKNILALSLFVIALMVGLLVGLTLKVGKRT